MLVTVGAEIYVNWLAASVALVPPLAVTVTFTVPHCQWRRGGHGRGIDDGNGDAIVGAKLQRDVSP